MTNTNDKNLEKSNMECNSIDEVLKTNIQNIASCSSWASPILEPVNVFKTLEYASELFRSRNLTYGEFEYSKHMIDVLTIGITYLNLIINENTNNFIKENPNLIKNSKDEIFSQCKNFDENQNKINNAVLNALVCHDILEDCGVTYNDLKRHIGWLAADFVYDVTNELGKNRKERSEKTYPKIKKNDYAIFIKCCDRLANIKFAKKDRSYPGIKVLPSQEQRDMHSKYVSEYPDFKKELYNGKFQELWNELDKEHNAVSFEEIQNIVI